MTMTEQQQTSSYPAEYLSVKWCEILHQKIVQIIELESKRDAQDALIQVLGKKEVGYLDQIEVLKNTVKDLEGKQSQSMHAEGKAITDERGPD